jgi:hypothetical protein
MIAATVALTSNPVPLVGDPKLSPTVPIAPSVKNSSSRRTTRYRDRLKETHDFRFQTAPPHTPRKFLLAKRFIGFACARL